MDEDETGSVLRGLKERRGPCPAVEELAALALGELHGEDRRRLESHVRLCLSCRELRDRAAAEAAEVDDLKWRETERRLARRPAPWRSSPRLPTGVAARWLAAAAVLVLGVGLATWVARSGLESRRPAVSTTRGASIDLAEPSGLVERIDRFHWSAPPIAATFRLELVAGDRPLFDGEVPAAGWQPEEGLLERLEPEVRYRWRVTALGPSGAVVARSPWAEFHLAR